MPIMPTSAPALPLVPRAPRRQPATRANQLEGKQWLRNSISLWDDLRKTPAELKLRHPAMFPASLAGRLIDTFLPPEGQLILDPFAGVGSTLLAAAERNLKAVGFEISPQYCDLTRSRLADVQAPGRGTRQPPRPPVEIHNCSADEAPRLIAPGSVDLCVTSPPYWDILNARRTADAKEIRNYGNLPDDLGTISDYGQFLTRLAEIFGSLLPLLKPGAYCCVVVMDLRKKDQFFPFHSDLASRLVAQGYLWDDLIIWDRRAEYNNLRPLGYPSVFRVNKVHEFVVILQKPRARARPQRRRR